MFVNYEQTEKLAVATAASATSVIEPTNETLTMAAVGNVAWHISLSGDATTDDMYIPANTIVMFDLRPGYTFNARGTSSGSVWVSRVRVRG